VSTLKLTSSQWKLIRAELHAEHPKSVLMIRDRMKSVLGFTVREHSEWTDGDYKFIVCLDFYNERKYTMFLLKFSELING
jgi:hypothetical protein